MCCVGKVEIQIEENTENLKKKNLFLSDEGPMLETLDYTVSVLPVHRPFYILIYKIMVCHCLRFIFKIALKM